MRSAGLAVLLTASLPMSASASPDDRVPNWQQSDFEEANPAIVSVYIYAVCARNHRRHLVEALLASKSGSPEERSLIPQVFPSGYSDCPVRQTGFRLSNFDFVRGAVAEAIYNGDHFRPITAGPLEPTSPVIPAGQLNPTEVGKWVADCTVRHAPRLAHEVMRYNYGSIGERRALVGLHDVFGSCLPTQVSLKVVPRLYMRVFIAQALYAATRSHPEAFSHA